MNVYKKIQENLLTNKKQVAVLLDPDKLVLNESFLNQIHLFESSNIDFFFVGGSIVEEAHFKNTMSF